MSTLLKPITVREKLLQRKIRIFTAQDFSRLFHSTPLATKYFLEEQTKQGFLLRLKRGIYTLKTDLPSEEEIANSLYRPSYISFEYALAYYNILPEMTYSVTSATTKPTRIFTVFDKSFVYYTIKKEIYTGYVLFKTEGKNFLIAEPEKALADYLYYVSIGHKIRSERLNLKGINKDKLLGYTSLFKRVKLFSLLKNI